MSPTSLTTPLYSSLANDPDLSELVDMFVAEMPERVSALEAAFGASDRERLLRGAHQLKGAAGSYGFETISPLAAAVEDAVRCGKPEDTVSRLLDALLDACRSARAGSPGHG